MKGMANPPALLGLSFSLMNFQEHEAFFSISEYKAIQDAYRTSDNYSHAVCLRVSILSNFQLFFSFEKVKVGRLTFLFKAGF
jgi:hypothetical protein